MASDLISREALLEFAHNHINGTIDCNDIARFPAVDAEPVRHGEWKRTQVRRNDEMHTLYVCSECNDYHGFRDDPGEHTFKENYHYCRLCGAKMDGGSKRD